MLKLRIWDINWRNKMIEWFTVVFTSIQSNPIVAGLFGTALIAGVVSYFKALPMKIFNIVKSWFTITIVVNNAEDSYVYSILLNSIISVPGHQLNQTYGVTFQPPISNKFYSKNNQTRDSRLIVSDGTSKFFRIDGILCRVHKFVDQESKMYRNSSLAISFYTRDKEKIRSILREWYILYESNKADTHFKCKTWSGNWSTNFVRKINTSNHQFTQQQLAVIDNVTKFLLHPEYWYDKNLIHKEGVLLHGVPGTGKSYFVKVLASMFNLPVYYLSLSGFYSENQLLEALSGVLTPSIILIEDIDCSTSSSARNINGSNYNNTKQTIDKALHKLSNNGVPNEEPISDKQSSGKLPLSSLLNIFDGFLSQEGQLIFVTTNNLQSLDSALLRSGRFNTVIEFKPHTTAEINKELSIYYEVDDSSNLLPENLNIEIPVSDIFKFCMQHKTIESCVDAIVTKHTNTTNTTNKE